GHGTFNLSAGTLNANTNIGVGNGGTGTFNQTGGSVTIGAGYSLFVGRDPTGHGIYNLSNASGPATLDIANANLQLGNEGNGSFSQNGGDVTLHGTGNSGDVIIANAATATGSYTTSAGTLTA